MSDRRLKVFHSVAHFLSFTKAADSLHMTQPAVTFQVRQLEEAFDTRLFDRTHNKVSLTEAGAVVFEYADRILANYAEMENKVRKMSSEVNDSLTIGASTTIAEYLLPQLLGDFSAGFPDMILRLKASNTAGVVSMLEHNVIDLGVVEGPVSRKNLLVETCCEDQLVVIMAPKHPLAQARKLPASSILEYPFICREEGSGTRAVFQQYLKQQGITANEMIVSLELASPEAIKGVVESGMGLAVVSLASLKKELKLRSLVAVPLDPPLKRSFSLVWQKNKFRMHALDEMVNFAMQYCKEHQTNH